MYKIAVNMNHQKKVCWKSM